MDQTEMHELLDTARDHFRKSEFVQAESILLQIVAQKGASAEILHMLGTIYYDRGKFSKAIKAFKRAIEMDPSFVDASVGLSIILNDLGRYEEGRQVFMAAEGRLKKPTSTETSSDFNSSTKIAQKHDELGEIYLRNGEYREAISHFERALNLSTRKPELRMKIIECWILLKEFTPAQKDLRALISEFPSFLPARLKLGLLFYQQGRTAEALEQWESVLLRDPQHPLALKYVRSAQEAKSTLLT